MDTPANNRVQSGAACVRCGKVDPPVKVGPGPGWVALLLWGASIALWVIGMVAEASWFLYPTAAVFLAALLYTLWYFYRREEACRHCRAPWPRARSGSPT